MNFGLVAHRLHRLGPDSSLLRWTRACEPGLQALGLGLHATGGAYDANIRLARRADGQCAVLAVDRKQGDGDDQ